VIPPPEAPPVVIATVEVESDGRFLASGGAAPGESVRLYVDDEFQGEAVAGSDGVWEFDQDLALAPGEHRVRVDQVADPSGAVASRAEVVFEVAQEVAQLAAPAPSAPPAAPPVAPDAAPPPEPSRAPLAPGASPSPGQSPVAVPPPAGAPAPLRPLQPLPAEAAPEAPASGAPAPDTITIRRGDNLWVIARRLYGAGIRYTTIYQANRDQIRDPHWIYPGQVFVIPPPDPAWGPR
jgi:nucleoid-associated protein YgaU